MMYMIYKNKKLTIREWVILLKKEFAFHNGEDNGITIPLLLKKYFKDYDEWNVWKKYSYIDITKKAIGFIRRKENVFLINKNSLFFVLKTQEEAEYYKAILKRDIIGMKKSIIKADEWVQEEKWKTLTKE